MTIARNEIIAIFEKHKAIIIKNKGGLSAILYTASIITIKSGRKESNGES